MANPSFGGSITLDDVLNTTLEKNPAIQQAKANLEQAAGRRLVLRSIVWPNVKLGAPAGVQGGHRAGENSTRIFGFARGSLTQPLINAAIPPSLRRGDVELLIAEQQLNLAVEEQLHAARLAFYAALYNRELQSVREASQLIAAARQVQAVPWLSRRARRPRVAAGSPSSTSLNRDGRSPQASAGRRPAPAPRAARPSCPASGR